MADTNTALEQQTDAVANVTTDISGVDAESSSDALDKLLAAAGGTNDSPPPPVVDDDGNPPADDAAAKAAADAEAKAAADADAANKAAAGTPPAPDPLKPAVPAIETYDTVALPPYSKPKTGEAFDKVKQLAKAAIESREKQISELNTQMAKLSEEVKSRLPAETLKELEELRNFRKSVDVENDPVFVEKFTKRADNNSAMIYTKLAEAGLPAEKIDQIKKLGGPAAVDWEPILPNLPPGTKRFIESKLTENDSLAEERKLAIADAKKNSDKFLSEREASKSQDVANFAAEATKTINEYLPRLPFAVLQDIPATATPAERAELEKHNAAAKQVQSEIQGYIVDKSAETKAALAISAVLSFRYKAESEGKTAQITDLQKKLTAVTTELDAIKKASQTSRARGGAPNSKGPVVSDNNPHVDTGTALDRLRAQVEAEHA